MIAETLSGIVCDAHCTGALVIYLLQNNECENLVKLMHSRIAETFCLDSYFSSLKL